MTTIVVAPLGLDYARPAIDRVVAHASKREHWYEPGVSPVPGADPRHVCRVGFHKCVYSVTLLEGAPHRHLSMSGLFGPPTPAAGFEIATAFGFTGWPGGDEPNPRWIGGVHEHEPGVVVLLEQIA